MESPWHLSSPMCMSSRNPVSFTFKIYPASDCWPLFPLLTWSCHSVLLGCCSHLPRSHLASSPVARGVVHGFSAPYASLSVPPRSLTVASTAPHDLAGLASVSSLPHFLVLPPALHASCVGLLTVLYTWLVWCSPLRACLRDTLPPTSACLAP